MCSLAAAVSAAGFLMPCSASQDSSNGVVRTVFIRTVFCVPSFFCSFVCLFVCLFVYS